MIIHYGLIKLYPENDCVSYHWLSKQLNEIISHRACLEINNLCLLYFARPKYKAEQYHTGQFDVPVALWNCIPEELISNPYKYTN
jgi:hypothetical protein